MTTPLPDWAWLLTAYGPEGDPDEAYRLAVELEAAGDLHAAAVAWNRAYGLDPSDPTTRRRRQELLTALGVELNGLRFRYVPGGTFLMGSDDGDPDEAPAHPVRLDPYWVQEAPLTWHDFQRVQGWAGGFPPREQSPKAPVRLGFFHLNEGNKIRHQYCGDDYDEQSPRGDAFAVRGFASKPMVSVAWQDVVSMALTLEDRCDDYVVDLPTEAEWERAARGGLIGRRYPWGDDPPSPDRADFDHFGDFEIRPPRQLPPNGYGLYGMAGGVWEWCSDWYDAEAYARRATSDDGVAVNPRGPARGLEKVLRGGSWADCAGALRVSFRSARSSVSWRTQSWGGHHTPNLGARLALRPITRVLP